MPCLLALIVFSVLSIFSASHRKWAKEAFGCVFRRVTLRPCDTGLETRLKAKVMSTLLVRSPKVAQFVHKRFELISWIFTLSLFASLAWTAYGLYNYWMWGSCNGLNSGGFCAFDPTGSHNQISAPSNECVDLEIAQQALSLEDTGLSLFPKLESKSDKQVVFLGCYACDFTRKTYPMIKDLMKQYDFDFTYIHFPTKEETKYLLAYDYCVNKIYPDKYFDWVDKLFGLNKEELADEPLINQKLGDWGMDPSVVQGCVEDEVTGQATAEWTKEATDTGIYGTPTIFIEDAAVVGPKPMRVYRRLISGSIF